MKDVSGQYKHPSVLISRNDIDCPDLSKSNLREQNNTSWMSLARHNQSYGTLLAPRFGERSDEYWLYNR